VKIHQQWMDAAQDDWMHFSLMGLLMPSKCFAGNSSLISQWFLQLFQWFKVVDIGYQ